MSIYDINAIIKESLDRVESAQSQRSDSSNGSGAFTSNEFSFVCYDHVERENKGASSQYIQGQALMLEEDIKRKLGMK